MVVVNWLDMVSFHTSGRSSVSGSLSSECSSASDSVIACLCVSCPGCSRFLVRQTLMLWTRPLLKLYSPHGILNRYCMLLGSCRRLETDSVLVDIVELKPRTCMPRSANPLGDLA